MQPFHIICVTCQARLKVQSAKIIGQIVSCPKCESMVQVTPPEGWSPTPESAAAGSQSSLDTTPSAEAGPTDTSPPQSRSTVATSSSETRPAESGHATPPPVSPTEQLGTRVALLVAGGGVVFAVALLTIVLLLRGGGGAEPQFDAIVPLGEPIVDEQADSVPEPPSQGTPPRSLPANASAIDHLAAAEDPPVALPSIANRPVSPSDESTVATPPPPASPDDLSPAETVSVAANPFHDAILDGLPADGGISPVTPRVEANDEPALEQPPPVAAPTPVRSPPATLPGDDGVMVRTASPERVPDAPIPTGKRLATPIPQFLARQVPLYDALQLVGDLSGLAISFEPSAVSDPQAALATPVEVKLENTTAGLTLDELLRPFGCVFSATGVHVRIVAAENQPQQREWNLADVSPPGADWAAWLARDLPTIIAPDSWQAGGGRIAADRDTLIATNTPEVLAHIDRLVATLSAARGPSPSSAAPQVQWEQPSFTLTLHELVPLREVIRTWGTQTGVMMLVDWQQLADRDVAPDTLLACSVVDRNPGPALDVILEHLELGWRSVGSQTIEITSLTNLIAHPEFRCYDRRSLRKSGQDAEAVLRAQAIGSEGSPVRIAVVEVPGSDLVLVTAAAPVLRRLDQAVGQ